MQMPDRIGDAAFSRSLYFTVGEYALFYTTLFEKIVMRKHSLIRWVACIRQIVFLSVAADNGRNVRIIRMCNMREQVMRYMMCKAAEEKICEFTVCTEILCHG